MKFLSDKFKEIDPYVVGEIKKGIYLNANEAFYNTPKEILDYAKEISSKMNLNRYPDTDCKNLKTAIASHFNVSFENVTCGVGSDELLDILLRSTATNKEVLSVNPTFGMYSIFTFMADGTYKSIDLTDDLKFNKEALIEEIKKNNPIITFICNPNNPTGSFIEVNDILDIVKSSKGIVVVDEAYEDFARSSVIKYVNDFDNLCVLRTFSKAYALAGIRCGYAISSKEIIKMIDTIKPPYTLNTFTQEIATYAIKNSHLYDELIEEVINNREYLYNSLKDLNIECYPSKANFIYLYLNESQKKSLEDNNIFVRYFKKYSRVTVGSKEENEAFLNALRG